MSSGLVSIICPMHNGAKFVDETISCVLSQTYTDFELLIIDDNSTDNIRIYGNTFSFSLSEDSA